MVKDGEVIIVDEFTGRMMPGRRWSDGLHQAVEAKEGVKIERENQTLATITFQNYFRMYDKLAGMTGTAETEAAEFDKIYKLDVIVIPTNRAMIRADHPDVVYRRQREKFERRGRGDRASCHAARASRCWWARCRSRSPSMLSKLLKTARQVPHEVLNAKYHEREAEIVAQAGRKGAVTIATNMAGRGTDILLGGNPEFLARAHEGSIPTTAAGGLAGGARDATRETCAEEHERGRRPWAASTSSAPSATSRAASTTSSAAAPAARATRARRASTSRSKTT